jgi:hypothetical protein
VPQWPQSIPLCPSHWSSSERGLCSRLWSKAVPQAEEKLLYSWTVAFAVLLGANSNWELDYWAWIYCENRAASYEMGSVRSTMVISWVGKIAAYSMFYHSAFEIECDWTQNMWFRYMTNYQTYEQVTSPLSCLTPSVSLSKIMICSWGFLEPAINRNKSQPASWIHLLNILIRTEKIGYCYKNLPVP